MSVLVSGGGRKTDKYYSPCSRHMLDTQCNLPLLFLSEEGILSVYARF